ncbi:hypothetical protein LXA43DRAFT_1068385 [Ganoderma leucocontextum]|nr:hypothetical protein LXA43DRAFT_1068385 [Ganoderma leucocontextum]
MGNAQSLLTSSALETDEIFIKLDPGLSLRKYHIWRLKAERETFADIPNVYSYQSFVETDKAGHIIRQWVASNLFDKIRSTFLPLGDPFDFALFFDTSGCRSCYIAPERFYAASETPEARASRCPLSASCSNTRRGLLRMTVSIIGGDYESVEPYLINDAMEEVVIGVKIDYVPQLISWGPFHMGQALKAHGTYKLSGDAQEYDEAHFEGDEKSLLLVMKCPVSRQIVDACVQWAMKATSAKTESPRESMATVHQTGGATSRARSDEDFLLKLARTISR